MNIRIICKHCGNEIGLYDADYITPRKKKYLKCNHCGNSEQTRRQKVSKYNKINNADWKKIYSLNTFLGVHLGFDFKKEVINNEKDN